MLFLKTFLVTMFVIQIISATTFNRDGNSLLTNLLFNVKFQLFKTRSTHEIREKRQVQLDFTNDGLPHLNVAYIRSLWNDSKLTVSVSEGIDKSTLTWSFQSSHPGLTGFLVTYRNGKQEHFDSPALDNRTTEFDIPSLDKDLTYVICVHAMVNITEVQYACTDFSQNSLLKIVVGLLSGVIFLVPCVIALVWLFRRDRKVNDYEILKPDPIHEVLAQLSVDLKAHNALPSALVCKTHGKIDGFENVAFSSPDESTLKNSMSTITISTGSCTVTVEQENPSNDTSKQKCSKSESGNCRCETEAGISQLPPSSTNNMTMNAIKLAGELSKDIEDKKSDTVNTELPGSLFCPVDSEEHAKHTNTLSQSMTHPNEEGRREVAADTYNTRV